MATAEVGSWEQLKLVLLISFQIPSILCHLVLIYHLCRSRTLRQALHNHVILVLLLINFFLITVDLSITMDFLRFGFIRGPLTQICHAWNFLDSSLSNASVFLMMWASLERHLVIFHDRQLLSTSRKRMIFHYAPLMIILSYVFIFYTFVIFYHPACSNASHFHADEMFCRKACYVHEDKSLSIFELLAHKILSSTLIVILCFSLVVRIVMQKLRRNQRVQWRRQRKMTAQVVAISTLYVIGTFPAGIGELFHILGKDQGESHENVLQESIFLFLFYFISLMLPFVCLMSLPEIYMKLVLFLRCQPSNRIAPVTITVRSHDRRNMHEANP